MKKVFTLNNIEWSKHPPYLDPGLTSKIGNIFQSEDKKFMAGFWDAKGPGELLEKQTSDELICILEGELIVEIAGEKTIAHPGDVVFWSVKNPSKITIPNHVKAFYVVYS
jgi:ethanolamine utilization protein EutQ (cupin superfamily)